jgi:anti-sigma regulatory factor (Ser/Thr protein kinase)
MSTPRPYPAGDRGPEPEGPATTAATSGAGTAGTVNGQPGSSAAAGAAGSAAQPGAQGQTSGQTAHAERAPSAMAPGRPGQNGSSGQNGSPGQPGRSDQSAQPGSSAQAGPSAQLDPSRQEEAGQAAATQEAAEQDRPVRQVRRLRLVGVSGAVPRARDFVRQALQDWGWLPAATGDQRAAAEDVLLVVSELVTNACLHAEGPEELRVGSGPKVLRLEIVDQGSGSPSPRNPHRAGRPGGHGMFIVQRLCLDWGVVRNPEGLGKTVWAELAAPGC